MDFRTAPGHPGLSGTDATPWFIEATQQVAEYASHGLDLLGIVVILAGMAYGGIRTFRARRGKRYRQLRQDVGRSILLGLEFLVAGDLIRTVAIDPGLERATSLAVIVLVRALLGITLEIELDGRLPWRRAGHDNPEDSF